MNRKNELKKEVYTVAIVVDECAYLYPCPCLNHKQALEMAFAAHIEASRPLPLGTRCLVDGPCQESDCNCGGRNRTMDCFTCTGT